MPLIVAEILWFEFKVLRPVPVDPSFQSLSMRVTITKASAIFVMQE